MTRREMLRTLAAASAGALAAGAFPLLGAETIPPPLGEPRIVGADEKVRVAAIGVGNQGFNDLRTVAGLGDVTLAALCDVDDNQAKSAYKQFPSVPRFKDYREMFAKMGDKIDAAVIATPDFTHFNIAMHAMRYGKHVYVEKPLTHTILEARIIAKAAKAYNVVTQMGNQGHSAMGTLLFHKWVKEGVIKNVTKYDLWMNKSRRWHGWKVSDFAPEEKMPSGLDWDLWLNKAPVHAFSREYHPGDWRSWYEFGNGCLGDWGAHMIDAVFEALNLGMPTTIEAELTGPSKLIFPQGSILKFSFPARGELPPLTMRWFDGRNNTPPPPADFDGSMKDVGQFIYAEGCTLQGTSHGATYNIVPETKRQEMAPTLPRISGKPSGHMANFINACKGKEEARSPFSIAARLTELLLLGVIAQRFGGTISYDDAAMKITGNPEADAMVCGYAPRKGWDEYYKYPL